MNAAQVAAVFESLELPAGHIKSELGSTPSAVYLKLWQTGNPDKYAVVSTPGDRWFSLDVPGGFSFNHFEEETDDAEVIQWVGRLVEAATAYVEGNVTTRVSRYLRMPSLQLVTSSGPVELNASVPEMFLRIFGRGSNK